MCGAFKRKSSSFHLIQYAAHPPFVRALSLPGCLPDFAAGKENLFSFISCEFLQSLGEVSAPLKASRGPLTSELSKHLTVRECVAELRVSEWRTGFFFFSSGLDFFGVVCLLAYRFCLSNRDLMQNGPICFFLPSP